MKKFEIIYHEPYGNVQHTCIKTYNIKKAIEGSDIPLDQILQVKEIPLEIAFTKDYD